jgi:hypothetical protein
MYTYFHISGQNLTFFVQNSPHKVPGDKNTISPRSFSIGFAKHAKLSATKMQVFYELLLPFWIIIFTFLLFLQNSCEIIVK